MNMRFLVASAALLRSVTITSAFQPRLLLFPTRSERGFAFASRGRFRATAKNVTPKKPKLNKKRDKNLLRADRVLSNRGWGSRSECTELIKRRRVSTPNGTLKSPSEKITMDTSLFVDGTPVPHLTLLLVYHKPKWVLSVMHDPTGRPNLGGLLSEVQKRQQLHPVGRLDYDTSGLLLFSTNGGLTQRLLHPTHSVEKEYVALVDGTVDADQLRHRLEEGVETTEGRHTAQLLNITYIEEKQVPTLLQKMRSTLPSEYNVTDLEERGFLFSNSTALSTVRLTVSEGKHRMVRRILANCGHGVLELRRERHGNIVLGDLQEGEFRELTENEQVWAESLLSDQKG
jgi:23S rRNA pseudouridine2605 synthase